MNRLTIAATAMFFALPAAFAQNNRSWVASTGSDTNPCTRAQPCATFQGAFGKTNANGEIDVVDPGDYGSVNISTAVTIDGGGMARITSASPNAAVHITSSAAVVIRNLSITGYWGFEIAQFFGKVHVENVEISNVTLGAFYISAGGGNVTIQGSTLHDVTGGGGFGLFAIGSVTVDIRDTTFSNMGPGNSAIGASFETTINVEKSFIVGNSFGVGVEQGGTIRLSDCTIIDNQIGLLNVGGTIISFVNNRIYGNGTDGSPTKSVYQR